MIARAAILGVLPVAILGCAVPMRSVGADCASVRLPALTVSSPPVEFPLAGFAITPPQGEHWCVGDQDSTKGVIYSTSALIGRRLESAPSVPTVANTLGVAAITVDPGDWKVDTAEGLRAYAEFRVREQPGRFRNLETHVSPESGFAAECVRMDQVAEERHNPRMPSAVFIVVNWQVLCRHPDSPRRAILIGASERHLQGDPGPRLLDLKKDQIDDFVRSLRFIRPQ